MIPKYEKNVILNFFRSILLVCTDEQTKCIELKLRALTQHQERKKEELLDNIKEINTLDFIIKNGENEK